MTATSHTQGATGDVPALRRRLAADLEAARARTRALTHDVFAADDADFTRQHSPLMSPFHWDVAHIANMEDYWLVRRGAPDTEETAGVREDLDQYYDAFTNPRAGRPQLPLLSPAEARAYGDQVREKALAHLEAGAFDERRTLAGGFVFGMIVQHEQQHVETMLATHQLRDGAPVLHADPPPASVVPGLAGTEIFHPGAEFLMGTSEEPFALDNEKPAHPVRVDDFWLDAAPVTNAEFARFVDAGGYADRSLWSEVRLGAHHRRGLGRADDVGEGRGSVVPDVVRGARGDRRRRRPARAARLLPRGRGLRRLGGEAPAHRGRVGVRGPLRPRHRASPGASRGATTTRAPSAPTSTSATCSPRRSAPTRPGPRRWACTS